MKIEGFDQVKEKLHELGTVAAKKAPRKALRAGAKIVKAEISGFVPVKTGNMKKNLKVKAAKRKRGVVGIIVGFGKKWFAGPAYYAAFVVFGHRTGKRNAASSGRIRNAVRNLFRGKVPPNNFMRKGYENSRQAALDKITQVMKEELGI